MSQNIVVSGTIICAPEDLEMLLGALVEHIRLSRTETGCLGFEIAQSDDDPCVFLVSERFEDSVAFDAHKARTRASSWWGKTRHIPRDLVIETA